MPKHYRLVTIPFGRTVKYLLAQRPPDSHDLPKTVHLSRWSSFIFCFLVTTEFELAVHYEVEVGFGREIGPIHRLVLPDLE